MAADRLGPAPVAVLLLIGVVTSEQERGKDVVAQLLVVAPLLARRRWPTAVFVLVGLVVASTSVGSPSPWVQVGAVALASYTTGERSEDRVRAALVVLIVAASISFALVVQDANTLQAVILPFVVLMPAWLLGDIVRQRRLDTFARAKADERALREAEARLQAAVAEERRTMARGAPRRRRPRRQRDAHPGRCGPAGRGRIPRAGHRGAADGRGDRARSDGRAPPAPRGPRQLRGRRGGGRGAAAWARPDRRAPRPVREAGLPAELEVAGTPRPLPPGLDVTVYRIVQEALTNALRYARRAATLVRLTWDRPAPDRDLDDGPAEAADGGDGAGRGLVGMRERALRVGGRLEAGPRLGGGRRPGMAADGNRAVMSDGASAGGAPAGRATVSSGGSTRPLEVLIVDDQALVRAGNRMILEAQPDIRVVAEASRWRRGNPARAPPLARCRPDGRSHAGARRSRATRRLLDGRSASAPRVIVLTTFDLDEYVYAALQSGASGFLLKDVSPEQLIAAVRTVSVGDALLAPAITRRLVERYARPSQATAGDAAALATLTAREREVFGLLARGMSNAEIADALVVGEATVKSHVAAVLAKLELRNRAQAVVLAYESGLIRAATPSET